MIGRAAALLYGMASYLVFFISFVYAVGFIGNFGVAKSIDVGAERSLALSILVDASLLGVFALQHSVRARPAFQRAFWATPLMTAGHLLFTVLTTGYILVGVRLEERDLVAHFGESYQQYRERVPMLLPRLRGGARPAAQPAAE